MNNKKFYAVAGFPVSHSKSPLIFNALFSSMKINAHYSRISARSGIEAFEMFKSLGINGMNITTPLKNDILPFADQTDESTDRTGGVNSLL
ncbi:MAG: shikimate dehydrogenase, partial [Acidobacteriota bacterium]